MCNPAGCLLSRYCFFVLARSLLIKLAGYSVFNKATQLKIRENHLWFDLLQFCRNISHLILNTELK